MTEQSCNDDWPATTTCHMPQHTLYVAMLLLAFSPSLMAQYPEWKHSGAVTILTTPDGAALPAEAVVENFPLLVPLHKDWFDFTQAATDGADIRFSTGNSAETAQQLSYQIEAWDDASGSASIWVRVPRIEGNARQTIRMHWGKTDAKSESNGKAVFNQSNGYLSVWHMGTPVIDTVGTINSTDEGTTATAGIVGPARHLAGRQGIYGGDAITAYPTGTGPMTTEAWFRAETPNSTVLAWGKEQRPGKVMMNFLSPPRVAIQCYFADVEAESALAINEWYQVVHTYKEKDSRVYINGRLDGASSPVLDIPKTSSLWIGGWYKNYTFIGDVDEVRVSNVVRSADWIRLQYENQKPLQTLVGPIVLPGNTFSVSHNRLKVLEGKSVTVSAQAGGAEKLFWTLTRNGRDTVVATDRLLFQFDAGRVMGDHLATLHFSAVYPSGVKTKDIPITVTEDIPEPIFTLKAPATWNGRTAIEVLPIVTNARAMQAKGAGELKITWGVCGMAVIQQQENDAAGSKLLLKRALNSGQLAVTATVSNGGASATQTVTIDVKEPTRDAWIAFSPAKDEMPQDNQFYARDDSNIGHLHCNGTLNTPAEFVFIKVYADHESFLIERAKLGENKSYAFIVKLKPGLVQYKVEFGSTLSGTDTVLHTASNLVCGDAFIIQGQSNALATDTGEESPPFTSNWIRSYGRPQAHANASTNLWCNPVWKAKQNEQAELGYWGMELAKRLVESRKIPIFIINGAVGGTRIDQHQRSDTNAIDLNTIYGRTLWRVQQARLTHGIRGILWHQGENNQGAASPTGDYDWKSYQDSFLQLSAAWKDDFPNLQHFYVFQIWPNACSMAGNSGAGDMVREVQRTLPRLYSHLSVMSTLGIKPPGPCHFPLTGWAEYARLIQPLIERDADGKTFLHSITPPNLQRAFFTSATKNVIALEFDQPVLWSEKLITQFYPDGEKEQIATGSVQGNVLTLTLKTASEAQNITYLKESAWSPELLLVGVNGIAALTFCNVPILSANLAPE